ncbi:MAG: DUF308 domain-containing protein [Solobacterium sp.]|nr:DUF308 domain-containing protein [Solobacterium sp.]
MLKTIKWSSLFLSIVYTAAGIGLYLYPVIAERYICEIMGGVCIAAGLIQIIGYWMMDIRRALFRNDFVEGSIVTLFGVLILLQKAAFQGLVPFIIAIVIISSGISKIQDGIDEGRIGHRPGWLLLIVALICIAAGVVVMLNVIRDEQIQRYVMAGGLAFGGITDLWSTISLNIKIRKYLKALEEKENEQTVTPPVTTPIDMLHEKVEVTGPQLELPVSDVPEEEPEPIVLETPRPLVFNTVDMDQADAAEEMHEEMHEEAHAETEVPEEEKKEAVKEETDA